MFSSFFVGIVVVGSIFWSFILKGKKFKIVFVGIGICGIIFWGWWLVEKYFDIFEFVGFCDINLGRLEFVLKEMQVSCLIYVNFEKMVQERKFDLVIVIIKDFNYYEFIIKGLDMGCDVLMEKFMIIDEFKCQEIIDVECRFNKNLIVGFNYCWSLYMIKIKEFLMEEKIGKVILVDFNWYLNIYYGVFYFWCWYGLWQVGGMLWVYKVIYYFDLFNWWFDFDFEEVFVYGDLEYYGSNGFFWGNNCCDCEYIDKCVFYWDIIKNEFLINFYIKNEYYDGYIWDNCLFWDEINIYDKMLVQIKYVNNVFVNYFLIIYFFFEGWCIVFNGIDGCLEVWQDILYVEEQDVSQVELYVQEMNQKAGEINYKFFIVYNLWSDYECIMVGYECGGYGGGDKCLYDKIFVYLEKEDFYERVVGVCDGVMFVFIGVAVCNSIEFGCLVWIVELMDLQLWVKWIQDFQFEL